MWLWELKSPVTNLVEVRIQQKLINPKICSPYPFWLPICPARTTALASYLGDLLLLMHQSVLHRAATVLLSQLKSDQVISVLKTLPRLPLTQNKKFLQWPTRPFGWPCPVHFLSDIFTYFPLTPLFPQWPRCCSLLKGLVVAVLNVWCTFPPDNSLCYFTSLFRYHLPEEVWLLYLKFQPAPPPHILMCLSLLDFFITSITSITF